MNIREPNFSEKRHIVVSLRRKIGVETLLSHPFARKKAKGWGTGKETSEHFSIFHSTNE